DGPADSVNVRVYANGAGDLPGTLLAGRSNLGFSGDPDFVIALSPGVAMDAGRYWLSVAAHQNFDLAGPWGWSARTGPSRARAAPVFCEGDELTDLYDKERTLYREVASRVERSLPGVEVLAVELTAPQRFTVFVDHPKGVDHALCGRVTEVLRDYLDRFSVDV